MNEPILVVDIGSWALSAAVVLPDQLNPVREPMTGAPRWPGSAALAAPPAGTPARPRLIVGAAAEQARDQHPRHYVDGVRRAIDANAPLWLGDQLVNGVELVSTALEAVLAEARRAHGAVGRLVLSAPAGYRIHDPRREALVAAASMAGFPDAELVTDAAAAVLDPMTLLEVPEGGYVLVCDLGAAWSATLAQVQQGQPVPVSHEGSGSGRDIDVMLAADLRATLAEWVEPAFAAGGDTSVRANLHALDIVRRLKHRLAEHPEAAEEVEAGVPAYRMDRRLLEQLTEPATRWLVASCRAVVARAGIMPTDVAAVLLVGGGARLPGVGQVLHNGLGRPVTRPADPEFAVLRGVAAWARARSVRAVPADPPLWRVEPLSWTVPGGRGRLVRWLVKEGEAYGRGAPIAQVRTADDRVYDLLAGRSEGILLEQRVAIGDMVVSGAVSAHARLEPAGAERYQLAKRHHLRVAGDWLLMPDRRTLVECSGDGEYVKVRAISTGALVTELRPGRGAGRGGHAQVALGPGQQLALVTWDADGHFAVWDVLSGRVTASFTDGQRPDAVLLNESEWRLVTTGEGAASVGRYRRDVATVWDLATGTRIDRVVGEDLPRRFTGYTETSRADAFATQMESPDGRLRAAALDGTLSVRDLETEAEVFRADLAPARTVSTAFCHEGRHLLARGRDDEGTWVDVWEVLQPA
ncbi:Hsp70 family protein [Dactylosporangium sp. CA-233914]|uniref:Hsp70 family protein n=1 Tax=Dactylosporangium sp. CA-233914 TaxID=3239934 RepID=UPI003D8B9230